MTAERLDAALARLRTARERRERALSEGIAALDAYDDAELALLRECAVQIVAYKLAVRARDRLRRLGALTDDPFEQARAAGWT